MRWANMWVIALLMQIKHFTFSHKVTLSLRFIKDNFSRWKLRRRRRCDDEYSSRSFHHHHQHNIFLAMAEKTSSCKPVCALRAKFLSSSPNERSSEEELENLSQKIRQIQNSLYISVFWTLSNLSKFNASFFCSCSNFSPFHHLKSP